ncbi:MAG TPA: ImmA/IrrE family metallo-endopeptidase [Gaiellaceae bacterium]|jgi:hypothetical protein|nr:ImmA/IrrE family metallo-endopeptidase [Gaiellaceae bacterium]
MGDALQVAEFEHREILRACGFAEDDVPGALAIATALLGERSVLAVPAAEVWGEGESTCDELILVREDLAPRHRDFVILHEVGEIWVARRRLRFVDFLEKERVCDAIAGALLAPTSAFAPALKDHRDDFAALAHEFDATETSMALRFGEVTSTPIRVVRPGLTRERGRAYDWSRGAARRALTDQPDRFVEIAA